MRVWESYIGFAHKKSLKPKFEPNDGLPYWREKLFNFIILIFIPIGILIYIPSILMAIVTKAFYIGLFDTLALIILLCLFFIKRWPLEVKKYIFIFNIYLLSVVLLLFLGDKGPGAVFMVGVSTLTSLLVSSKAGYITLGINILVYLAAGISILFPTTFSFFIMDYDLKSWFTIAANFVAINSLIILSIPVLVEGLNKSINNERLLREQIIVESKKLLIEKNRALVAEKELKESEKRFALAVNGTNDILWDWPDTNQEEFWVSPLFYKLLEINIGNQKISRAGFLNSVFEPDLEKLLAAESACLIGHAPLDIELRLNHANGNPVWFRMRGKVNIDENNIARFAGSLQDISHRKKIESELDEYRLSLEGLVKKRTLELETKNKELKNFNQLFVGREFRIKELRDKIKELEGRINKENSG